MKKKMFCLAGVLLAALSLTSCSNDEKEVAAAPASPSQTWTVNGEGGVAEGSGMHRSIGIGGNTGSRRYFFWDAGMQVYVYSGSADHPAAAPKGTLSVVASGFSQALASLSGTITGTYTVGDPLYYYSYLTQDFTGQKGTVADVSANYTYLKATPTVAEVDGENHVLEVNFASFTYAEAMAFFKFKNEAGDWLRPSKVVIRALSGKLVQTVAGDGTKTYGPLTVNISQKDGMYPYEIFVALKTDYSEGPETYLFTVYDGDDIYESVVETPSSCYTRSNVYADGQYYAPDAITLPVKPIPVEDVDNTIQNWGNGGTTAGSTNI